ncbi:MAG: integrase [Gammaproteobacteria bacterium]|nr:MAG: integrase [Gammaproteobacteria bacterium]
MKASKTFQSAVAADFVSFISLKQALGRHFKAQEIILLNLDRFLCEHVKSFPDLNADTFKQWCQTMESLSSNTRLNRMRTVRNFCLYRKRTIPDCFVPDPTQFPQADPGVQPYMFSDIEVANLLTHSGSISDSPRSPFRAAATRLAIILLYTTGLRRGELLRLNRSDYNYLEQTLTIRTSKFYKSRILPLPDDVAMEVKKYLKMQQPVRPRLSIDSPLIYSAYCGGRPYSSTQLRKNLHILFNQAGIKKADGKLPRIHDFRFSFAVNALLRYYRNGVDVQSKLPFLAAYMGHVSIVSTYHYLRFIAPLATLASSVFAASYGDLVREPEEVCHEI